MYHNYFGLKEPAFSIAVNPHYLYMSQQHKEALAHLLYGVKGGGFVLLSGEVGTGKTTIIRCLLEQLPSNTDMAIVLNPMANASEMLSTICEELGAPYIKDSPTNKDYTDALYEYLLDNHSQGRNTVLLIDEAQLLSPESMEQIRLLTNLETTTQKLLQIILVGQPELNELLAQPKLRQLSQRITARFHLRPLNETETHAYIAHRLGVAGMPEGRNPFPTTIIKRIHLFTGGIPRLINIVCERSLVGAYGHNRMLVDRDIFELAKREVTGNVDQSRSPYATRYWKKIAAISFGLTGVLALTVLYFALSSTSQAPTSTSETSIIAEGVIENRAPKAETQIQDPAQAQAQAQAQADSVSAAVAPNVTADADTAASITPSAVTTQSVAELFIDGYSDSQQVLFQYLGYEFARESRPCWLLIKSHIECEKSELATWDELRDLNRPAVLTVTTPAKFTSHVVLIGLKKRSALLLDAQLQKVEVPLTELGPRWTGETFYLWYRPPGFDEPLGLGSSSSTVTWLAEQFASLDQQPEPLSIRKFNKALQERVKIFQRNLGLEADGIVGKQTLLRLTETLDLDKVLVHDF